MEVFADGSWIKGNEDKFQGSVKVAGARYLRGHECITREETPHPPPCGPPSPQGRGREIKITPFSQGRGCPTEEGR